MRGHLLLLLSSVFFASSILCTTQVMDYIPAFTLNGIRFLIGGLFLYLLGKGIPFRLLKASDILWSLLRGWLGIAFYYILETFALEFISAQMVSVLVGLSFVFSISYEILKKEVKITKQLIIIIGMILMGMAIVSWDDFRSSFLNQLLIGTILMIAANISWVAYVRLEKTKPLSLETIQIVSLDMLLGALCIWPGALMESAGSWTKISIPIVAELIYLAIFPSAIAYYLYNKAAKTMSSSICSMYLNLIPVLSVLIVTCSSTNTLAMYEWIGIIGIGGCVLYTSYYYEKCKKVKGF